MLFKDDTRWLEQHVGTESNIHGLALWNATHKKQEQSSADVVEASASSSAHRGPASCEWFSMNASSGSKLGKLKRTLAEYFIFMIKGTPADILEQDGTPIAKLNATKIGQPACENQRRSYCYRSCADDYVIRSGHCLGEVDKPGGSHRVVCAQ